MNPEDQKPSLQSVLSPTRTSATPTAQGTASAPATSPAQTHSPIIRTYESDVADAVKQKHASVASIVMAENKNISGAAFIGGSVPSEPTSSRNTGKKILFVIIGIILIGGGAWGGYYFYSQSVVSKSVPTTPAPKATVGIFNADSQTLVDINTVTAAKAVELVSSAQIPAGEMREIVLTKTVEGGKTRVTPQEILTKIGLTIPDNLSRSLTSTWMAGIYRGPDATTNTAFIILTTDFFQNAFSGMLKWEPTMVDDIASLIPKAPINTSSTSTPIQSFFSIQGRYEDSVLKSKDVRSFRDNAGNIRLVYSFIDQKTLVITQNEDTLREIMTRIEKRAYIR